MIFWFYAGSGLVVLAIGVVTIVESFYKNSITRMGSFKEGVYGCVLGGIILLVSIIMIYALEGGMI